MAIKSDYISGTLSITTGSLNFTGTGTGWNSAGFKEGDTIIDITGATEYMGVIESITGETTGVLTKPWEGPTLTNVAYRMRYQPDGSRSTSQARNLIEILGNGNLTAFAMLDGSANQLPMFTGPGAMTLVSRQNLVSGANYDVQVDTLADRADYDGQDTGFSVLVSNIGDGRSAIYSKNSATSGDWSDPAYVTGPGIAIEAGTTTTLPPGNNATLDVDTIPGGYSLNFGIPRGNDGPTGPSGMNGLDGTNGTNGTNGVDGIDGTSLFSRVRVVSNINVDISNLNNGDTIDGVVIATNWLVLLAGQTNETQNGVYVVGATAGTTVRAAAFDSYDELPGTYFSVMQGIAYADTLWKCSSDLGGVIGVDDLVFELFASSEGFLNRTYLAYPLNSGITYTLPAEPTSSNSLDVYVGGILQPKNGLAYTYSGTTLTLSEDPGTTDLVEVYIFQALAMGEVPDGSVGADQINTAQTAAIRAILGVPDTTSIREKLTANRTYYVRTDGSDSNNGLANTSGGAFLTVQKAIDTASMLDSSIYDVIIQVASGTYDVVGSGGIIAKNMVGSGSIVILGDETTPANVTIKTSGTSGAGTGVFTSRNVKTTYKLRGVTITSTAASSTYGIIAAAGSYIEFQNCAFGTGLSIQIRAEDAGVIRATGNYSIIGGGGYAHIDAVAGGLVRISTLTITITGTPAFTTFLSCSRASVVYYNGHTFVGSATGARYTVSENGVIVAGGETYLPGNAAGTRSSGGVYNSLAGGVRELLTANRTYYVRTDGSNNNTGLANTTGGAFLTLQKAWDTVAALDLSIYTVTIQVADGTYTTGINMAAMPVGGSGIFITGNNTTPANVHLNCTTTCFEISAPLPCSMTIDGFKCTFTGNGLSAVYIRATGVITVLRMELAGGSTGFAGGYRANGSGAKLQIFAAQNITGSMSCYAQALGGGVIQFSATTITLTGTPAFSWLCINADSFGYATVAGVTFSGSATGTRYGAGLNGGINTGGGGASFIPGSVNGSVATNGWYV